MRTRPFLLVTLSLLFIVTNCNAQDHVFAEWNGVQLLSIPQPSPGEGFIATKIQARSVDTRLPLVTYTGLSISNAHQTWLDSPFQSANGNALGPPVAGPTYAPEWVPYDSHLLIRPETVGGEVLQSYFGITETNDGTSPASGSLPTIMDDTISALTGYGQIEMPDLTGGFFVLPEFQHHTHDVAYLVTRADGSQEVELSVGILGGGELSAFFGSIPKQPVAEPLIVPFASFADRISSISSPTQVSPSFGDDIVIGSQVDDLYLPITVAPGPNDESNYYVKLTDFNESGDAAKLFSYHGQTEFTLSAGRTHQIGPFSLRPHVTGDWTGQFQLEFNDGSIVDATLSANIVPTGEPFSIIAEQNGMQLIAIPQESPGAGFSATKLQVRAVDPTEAIAAIDALELMNVHDVSFSLSGQSIPDLPLEQLFDSNWRDYNSHVLINQDMLKKNEDGQVEFLVEQSHDGTTTDSLDLIGDDDPFGGVVTAESGFGNISTQDLQFTDYHQTNSMDVAYVVSSEDAGPIELVLGIVSTNGTVTEFGQNETPLQFNAAAVPEPALPVWCLVIGGFLLRRRSNKR